MGAFILALVSVALTDERAAPATESPPPAPELVLEDQFQKPHTLPGPNGDVVVLVFGDRVSAAANHQVYAALHVYFHPAAQGQPLAVGSQAPARSIPGWPAGVPVPNVRVVPITCPGNVPGLIASIIRSQLRSRFPDLPVCLDFADKMKQFYGLAPGATNLAVIDTRGHMRYLAHGDLVPPKLIELTRFIEKLRLEARPGAQP